MEKASILVLKSLNSVHTLLLKIQQKEREVIAENKKGRERNSDSETVFNTCPFYAHCLCEFSLSENNTISHKHTYVQTNNNNNHHNKTAFRTPGKLVGTHNHHIPEFKHNT